MSRAAKVDPQVNRYALLIEKQAAKVFTNANQCAVRQESIIQRLHRGSLRSIRKYTMRALWSTLLLTRAFFRVNSVLYGIYPYSNLSRDLPRADYPRSQIRQGIASNTKGTAFVVYEDVMDAKSACDKLNGFNFQNRYLVVLYHQPDKLKSQQHDLAERQENLEKLKREHGID